MNLRPRPKPRPAPAFDRAEQSPHRQPPTPEACQSDYATGKQARKGLGKPAG